MTELNPEECRRQLSYNPDTGLLMWKEKRQGRRRITGQRPNKRGYLSVRIEGKCVAAHRVIWAIHYGEDPGKLQVDHIDRDRCNNRIDNLRLVTNQENRINCNSYWGVHRHKNRWRIVLANRDDSVTRRSVSCPLLGRYEFLDHRRNEWGVELPFKPG